MNESTDYDSSFMTQAGPRWQILSNWSLTMCIKNQTPAYDENSVRSLAGKVTSNLQYQCF